MTPASGPCARPRRPAKARGVAPGPRTRRGERAAKADAGLQGIPSDPLRKHLENVPSVRSPHAVTATLERAGSAAAPVTWAARAEAAPRRGRRAARAAEPPRMQPRPRASDGLAPPAARAPRRPTSVTRPPCTDRGRASWTGPEDGGSGAWVRGPRGLHGGRGRAPRGQAVPRGRGLGGRQARAAPPGGPPGTGVHTAAGVTSSQRLTEGRPGPRTA